MEQEPLYTGAIEHPGDDRNLVFEDTIPMGGEVSIDWKKGYDVRNILGTDIKVKNQKQTLSCVGQSWAYYFWVLQVLDAMKHYGLSYDELKEQHPKEVEEISAKAVYSQIFLPNGGAYIMKGAQLGVKWGAVLEKRVPSNRPDGSTDEKFVRELTWKTPEVDKKASSLRGKEYRVIRARDNMDLFAKAILDNHGVVGGVRGQNGRGWRTERPKPPIAGKKTWGHAIAYLAFGEDEHGKYIATPNSWGDFFGDKWEPGAPPGYGWQKLYEDYFVREWQFDPWVVVDQPNPEYNQEDMLKLVKGDQSPHIYAIGKTGKLHKINSTKSLQEGQVAGMWEVFDKTKHEIPQSEVDAMPKGHEIGFLI